MAQDQSADNGADAKCTSAAELLKDINKELADFEAKKLGELKTALEAFVTKQDALVAEYTAAYPKLHGDWCSNQRAVATHYSALKHTHDPASAEWKDLVKKCICDPQRDVACLADTIAKRKRCCYGKRERELDLAQGRFDVAKGRLDALVALTQGLKTALKTHADLSTAIDTLPVPGRAVVLYLFWFKLLPEHNALAPKDLPDDCTLLGDDMTPKKICGEVVCPPEEGACAPPKGGEAGYGSEEPERTPTWLMPPDSYRVALDCAWDRYRKAKDELALAKSAFQRDPDDLATLVKQLGPRWGALEKDITTCLKAWKPDDPCCGKSDDTQERGT